MAAISSILIAATLVRSLDTGVFSIQGKPVLPAAAQGDTIQLFVAPHAMRIVFTTLKQPASLGAGVTVQPRKNKAGAITYITNATAAGVFSNVTSGSTGATDVEAGDVIELLVGGAAYAGGGTIEYDFLCQRA